MSRSVFWALVRKDLYINRGIIIAIIVVGVLSWLLMGQGGKAMAVGGVLFLTANVAGAIFLAVISLLGERRDQARLFALSLPVSGRAYGLSKLASGYLAFGLPWLFLTTLVVGALLLKGGEGRGMVVYALLIQLFVMAQFSVALAAYFSVVSEAMSGIVILVVNIVLSLFMMLINQSEITAPWKGEALVWTPFARTTLTCELLVIAASLGLAVFNVSRRRDHL